MTAECTITTDRQCSPCIAPTYSDDGISCKQCDGEGNYNDIAAGASSCKSAPAGFKPISVTDRTGIVACPAGTYSIGGKTSCTACPAGKYSEYDAVDGAVGCTACDLGSISSEGSSSCAQCSAPTFSGDGLACSQCDGEGKYNDEDGAAFCKTVKAGYKPTEDRKGEEACQAGTFSIGANSTCTPCPEGTFSKAGASSCLPCPQHETRNDEMQSCDCMPSFSRISDDSSCTCNSGETLMGTSCEPCEKGKWKSSIGVTSCSRCEDTLKGAITERLGSTSVSSCICPPRTYDDGKGSCVPIEEGMSADLSGMTLSSLTLEEGFWRTDATSSDVRPCNTPDACVGGNDTSTMCRDGHTGPYCALCVDKYNLDPFMLCKECSWNGKDVVFTIFSIVFLAALLFGAYFLLKKKLGGGEGGKEIWKR